MSVVDRARGERARRQRRRRGGRSRSGATAAAAGAGAAAADAGFSLAFARSFSYLYDFVASVRPYLSSCSCRLPRGLRQQRRQTGKMFGKVSSAPPRALRISPLFLPHKALNGCWRKRTKERERECVCVCVLGGNNTAARASRLARGPIYRRVAGGIAASKLESVYIEFAFDAIMNCSPRHDPRNSV